MKYLLFIALLCIIPAFCNTSKPKPDLAGPSCGICQFVVSELDKFIDSQSSKQEIEAVLEKVCDVIPKSVKPVCDEFVKEYTPVLVDLLVQKADPLTICTLIGTCPKTPQMASGIECTVCHWAMAKLEDYITKESTEAQIVAAVEKVCMELPAFVQSPCKSLIETYGPQIIQLLVDKENPETVCAQIGLCKRVVAPVSGATECAVCKWILVEIEKYITNETTEAQIVKYVEHFCEKAPASLRATCDAFVEEYGAMLIDMLIQRLDPNVVCEKLGLCVQLTPDDSLGLPIIEFLSAMLNALDQLNEGLMKLDNGFECPLCEWIMTEIDKLIEENATETEIEKALQTVCMRLPTSVRGMCDDLVVEYTPIIIETLVNKIPPEKVCKFIHLCDKTTVLPPPPPPPPPPSPRGIECALCEWVMRELEALLKKNATEAEIEAALEKVCSLLPKSVQGQCDTFVELYTPKIIDLITQAVPPSAICAILGLCAITPPPPPPPMAPTNSMKCVVCEWVMTEIDDLLEKNATETEVEKALEKVCGFLPDSVKTMCDDFVEEYTPILIQLLVEKVPPEKICTVIGLCSKAVPSSAPNSVQCAVCEWVMSELDSLLEENATQAEIEKALDIVCTKLPSSLTEMCNALVEEYTPVIVDMLVAQMAPDKVCALIGLCKDMPRAPEPAPPNTIKCAICEWVMAELDKLIEENATETEIEKGLEKVCMLLPTSVRTMCDDLVEEYTPVIIDLLVSKVPPEKVCQAIGLCGKTMNRVGIIYVHTNIIIHAEEDELSNPADSYKCVVCEWAMAEIEKLIEKNATETQIEKALELVCTKLPASIRTVCDEFVEEYTPILIDMLVKRIPPELVCAKIGLCTALTTAPKPQTIQCGVCEWLMTELDAMIEKSSTEAAIEAALEKVCALLPASVRSMCDGVVEAYTPEIIKMLIDRMPPEKICQALGLCAKTAEVEAPVADNSAQCAVCEWVIAELDSLLEENATETEIEKALEIVCSKLPSSIVGLCDAFVEEYTPVLIELLVKQVAPDKICTIIGLCKASVEAAPVGSIKCAVCEWVLTELDDLLEENATETEIEKALEKVCGFLPTSLKTTCDEFVEEYTPILIELLVKEVPPEKICTIIGLCGKATNVAASKYSCPVCKFVMAEIDEMLGGQVTKDAVVKALDKVCLKLPAMLQDACNSLVKEYAPVLIDLLVQKMDPALICTKLSLCPKTTALPEGAVECTVCQWVIQELEVMLQSDRSEAAIEAALKKVCALLPKSVRDVCDDFVVVYGPALIKLLVKEASPAKVCTMLGLCAAAPGL